MLNLKSIAVTMLIMAVISNTPVFSQQKADDNIKTNEVKTDKMQNKNSQMNKNYSDLKEAFNKILEFHSKGDVEGLISLFAPTADVVMYGTGVQERYVGIKDISAALRKSFKEVDNMKIETPWVKITGKGPVAWVNADCNCTVVAQGKESKFPARLTVVYEDVKGNWKIVSTHFSLPAPEEPYYMQQYQTSK